MQALLITTGTLLFVVYRSLLPQWRSGKKRIFWISAVATGCGYILLALACFEIYTPGLMMPIDSLVRWIFGL